MANFLGTKISDIDLNEVKEELRKKNKNYDEYDLYVYYKKLVELEKIKNEKKKKRKRILREDDEGFKPCNYISSIYNKNKKKITKNIYDYIDQYDNIYEDIYTNDNFQEQNSYTDNINFTFFNDSISYELLRKHNYIDGIPIGLRINDKEYYNNSNISNFSKNWNKQTESQNKCKSSLQSNETPNYYQNQDIKYFKTNIDLKCEIVEEKEKNLVKHKEKKTYESNFVEKNINKCVENKCREIGPKLPDIFDQVRKHEIIYKKNNNERLQNEYLNILSRRNRIISFKLKEQKEFEKKIKEIYKPKNNFEGAFFDKEKTCIKNITKKEFDAIRTNFLEHKYGQNKYGQHKYDQHKYGQHKYDQHKLMTYNDVNIDGVIDNFEKKKKKFVQVNNYDNYSDSSCEYIHAASDIRKMNKNLEIKDSDEEMEETRAITKMGYNINKETNENMIGNIQYGKEICKINELEGNIINLFTLYDTSNYEKVEVMALLEFYSIFYKRKNKNKCIDTNKNIISFPNNMNKTKMDEIYIQYSKLINLQNKELSNKELINLYAPNKKWTHATTNNEENENKLENDIASLKNKINFNDLKKKNRFLFFCKMKENNNIKKNAHIFSKTEYNEFDNLSNMLKIYHLNFYTNNIINESKHNNTDMKIQNYEFSKSLYEKLKISDMYNKDDNTSKNHEPTLDILFFNIPSFFFITLFSS
ncbi:conserved Plasmodium protein, unknown function [Plasmodium yoelii]|uniref:Uncharacterized protein n=2 Tax=Plasmodium yoelii TaxID=5861 RepID=A0AAE9WWJ1_PLAYO|nr:conserved Plasmodium protein, unknown function [Plasmodium yoelii]WBY60276.1 hypothetical protein Py17XNL_001303392 [Plasmodium yoelii yoelii]CDU20164.1 conserved Plasmodium protein, unknown function [Plasmodium yoelii]VTZ80922.1 conserved Plasmodium protein, unknown function [Plasmodium yoelii]|eukprot:XP_022813705.1 conserved Plasmodium protein, unknown function [Plasmodium yoelii]